VYTPGDKGFPKHAPTLRAERGFTPAAAQCGRLEVVVHTNGNYWIIAEGATAADVGAFQMSLICTLPPSPIPTPAPTPHPSPQPTITVTFFFYLFICAWLVDPGSFKRLLCDP
jgi:hypothetical protein